MNSLPDEKKGRERRKRGELRAESKLPSSVLLFNDP